MLYSHDAFNLEPANLSCNSVQVKTTPMIVLDDDSITKRSVHFKDQPVSEVERSSVPPRRHRSDVFVGAENPLLNIVDRVIAPKQCIICGHQAKEGQELRRHLLARLLVVGPMAPQRGRPLILTRVTLRHMDDQDELHVLFDKLFSGRRQETE